jgi:tetratricopeptide (TPR) repeat protein
MHDLDLSDQRFIGLLPSAWGATMPSIQHGAYERAIAVDSSFVEAYNNLGQLYKGQERYAEAIELYKKAIALKADFPAAYVNLGRLFLQQFGEQQQYSAYARERLQVLAGP